MTERTIIHLDLDAFFCAVEEQHNPQLRGKPFAVGGSPDKRGVVASCSYAARVYGVRSAMPMARAIQLCPDLIIVRHHHENYRAVSQQVMAILHDTTPFVEQLSIDEAFLDMTGFLASGRTLAEALQKRINTELGLACSLGVASNKLVAKIANNIGKARQQKGVSPNAIEVVPHGEEAAFLAPLPVTELWGVGPKTAERLHQLGIKTIGDLAQQPERTLIDLFGKNGYDLHLRARGIDGRPVETERPTKSISRETTFDIDETNRDILLKTLRELGDDVGRQLRHEQLRGTTVKLKIRWADFTTLTRQTTFKHALADDATIYQSAVELFNQVWDGVRSVRLIGVGVSGFDHSPRQLSLWDDPPSAPPQRAQATIDDIRDRFGKNALKRASDLD